MRNVTPALCFVVLCVATTTITRAWQPRPVTPLVRTAPFVSSPTSARATTTSTALPMATVDVGENVAREMTGMDEWSTMCGVQRCEGFQFYAPEDTESFAEDWAVMTTEDLPEGSPVLYVPHEMILSVVRAKEQFQNTAKPALDQLLRLGAGDQTAHFYLFMKILSEYEQGEESPWFPWLNSLPRLYFNAVSMTNFCYECLPPLVFSYARGERVKFDNFCAALEKLPPNTILSQATLANQELLKWAFNAVYTRSFGEGIDLRIVPMADMFNHGTETEIALTYDEEGNCSVFTTCDVPANSPLRMSYGDPTNPSKLFASYGFLDETSPATFCKIMNIQPTPELRDLGLDFSRMLFYKDTGDVSEEVWDVLLYQVLAKDRDTQQAFYQAHMNGDVDTKMAIHQDYMFDTVTALKTHVDTFLEQLEDLSAKADGKDYYEHPRLPLILRHNEFVKVAFLAVKEQIDPMVRQSAPAFQDYE